jgi:hypothetical protein
MSDEEFEEDDAAVVEDLDEAELEDDDALEDDLDTDLADDADLPAVVDLESPAPVEPAVPAVPAAAPAAAAEGEEEEDVLELDEELHPDDVEAPLDALLQERTASATLEDEEEEVEEEEAETDERGEGPTKIVPRRPGEFLCASCFLVLPRNQLADEERMLCRDCA